MTTLRFTDRNSGQDPLLAKAAELPKDIAPSSDLWPGIAARLDEAPRRTPAIGWPMAIAAALLVAAVSALLTWGLLREPAPAENRIATVAAKALEIVPVDYGGNFALTARELSARDELLAQFRKRLDALSPETRAAVVKNLAIIQQAADEIDAALAQDPGSGMLNELLLGAYKQELQLYSKVVSSGDGTTRST